MWRLKLGFINGYILLFMAILQILPMMIAYGNDNTVGFQAFLLGVGISAFMGAGLIFGSMGGNDKKSRRAMFSLPFTFWVFIPVFTALPFYFSYPDGGFLHAYFESVSALTTTGASIINNNQPLTQSVLFFRGLLGWIGGLSTLVMTVAVFHHLNIGGMFLYTPAIPKRKGEMMTARIIAGMQLLLPTYALVTALCVLFLIIANVDPFEALLVSFSAISTTGFHYAPWYEPPVLGMWQEIILSIFMLFGATNIFLLRWSDQKRYNADKSKGDLEMKTILAFSAAVFILIATYDLNFISDSGDYMESIVSSLFTTVSAISTTGFAPASFYEPTLFIGTLFAGILLVGGAIGSTTGGIKVIRLVTLFRHAMLELRKLAHPHVSSKLMIGDNEVSDDDLGSIWLLLFSGIIAIVVGTMILSASGNSFSSALGTAIVAATTSGPAIQFIDPEFSGYHMLNPLEQIVFIVMMVFGRVEGALILAIFTKAFWDR
jgi:trk system potassium uptake protein TrkH